MAINIIKCRWATNPPWRKSATASRSKQLPERERCPNLNAKEKHKISWWDFVAFPLTPTLSLWERENRLPPLLKIDDCIRSARSGKIEEQAHASPSPQGRRSG